MLVALFHSWVGRPDMTFTVDSALTNNYLSGWVGCVAAAQSGCCVSVLGHFYRGFLMATIQHMHVYLYRSLPTGVDVSWQLRVGAVFPG